MNDVPESDLAGDEEPRYRVHLCFGPNCTPRGSRELMPVLEAAIVRAGIANRVEVMATSCRNRCDYGPSMNVYPGPVFYNYLTEEAIIEIVEEHLLHGRPVERWIYRPPTFDLDSVLRNLW
ncbi:MAG TPA: (2Fe-2S) ferredoxin domain-containing protein [Thermomicrobiales bacterium]|nr:(2Fe-2S) ferredoxin domain-containing protein [Thermomicrobiales bacterium]